MAARPETFRIPVTPDEKELVQEQLERLLSSHAFRNSQRYPAFLRYVVEQTLADHADQLKERTLGMDVFHRTPNYDTNADPVVRVTAGEVRKRLAQYYQEHGGELRIELPSGSYVPHFHLPGQSALEPKPFLSPASLVPVEVLSSPLETVPAENTPEARRARWWKRGGLLAVMACLLLAGLALGTVLLRQQRGKTPDALSQFWRPMMSAQQPPGLILGGRVAVYFAADGAPLADGTALSNGMPLPESASAGKQKTKTGQRATPVLAENHINTVALGDALSFARIAGLLSSRGSRYEGASAAQTSLQDLRARPTVLLGAFNNAWSLHAAGRLRYHFAYDAPPGYSRLVRIEDSRNPREVAWQVDCQQPLSQVTRDYAIVARYFDQETEQEVVIAAGLLENGTTAAAEFLTSDKYLSQLDQFAPPGGWAGRNLEAVLETEVVGGRSGPPRVIAATFW